MKHIISSLLLLALAEKAFAISPIDDCLSKLAILEFGDSGRAPKSKLALVMEHNGKYYWFTGNQIVQANFKPSSVPEDFKTQAKVIWDMQPAWNSRDTDSNKVADASRIDKTVDTNTLELIKNMIVERSANPKVRITANNYLKIEAFANACKDLKMKIGGEDMGKWAQSKLDQIQSFKTENFPPEPVDGIH